MYVVQWRLIHCNYTCVFALENAMNGTTFKKKQNKQNVFSIFVPITPMMTMYENTFSKQSSDKNNKNQIIILFFFFFCRLTFRATRKNVTHRIRRIFFLFNNGQ